MALRANVRSEISLLSTYCNTQKKIRQGEIWMRVRPEYFGTDATRELYDRIVELTEEANEIPTFRVLKRDSRLSQEAKALLKATDNTVLSRAETETTLVQLRDCYKLRVMADLQEELAKAISSAKAPRIDVLEKMLEEALAGVRNPEGSNNDLLHGGTGDTRAADLVVSILRGDSAKDRIKTGWGVFDVKSGGFSRGDLVVLSANFGGGKSVAALTLFRNMHNFGYRTAMATMEMENKEVLERMLASLSGVEYAKIRLNKMSREEKRRVVEAFDKFDAKENGARWTYYSPSTEVTIRDIFQALSPYKYDVIFIDYIGLLKQVSSIKGAREDQMLGEAARYCKIMAKKLNCVVVLLAQINDEGKVFSSRAITHHANFWMKWQTSEEDKARGFVTIEQGKARSGETYDFTLTTEFSKMQMNSCNEEPVPREQKQEKGFFKKGGGKEEPVKKQPVKMSLLD